MKRWHEDYYISLREWRKHRRNHIDSNDMFTREVGKYPYKTSCRCQDQKGRFRKKDAYDCGNTRCGICHSDKFPKRHKHEQEILSELSFLEQLKELDF